MEQMFLNCGNLQSLDLSGFSTSKVDSMIQMFYRCSSLTSLDLSGFDTSGVTSMKDMFSSCRLLKTIKVSDKWSTGNVNSSTFMFHDCTSLVGGNGTVYDSNFKDKTYARIDKEGEPGYLTDAVIHVAGVHFDEPKITLKVGDEYIIKPVVDPEDATDKKVRFRFERGQSCISVSERYAATMVYIYTSRKIKAIAPGTTKVTVTTYDGSFKAVLTIKVVEDTVKGDLDGDGYVTTADLNILARHVMNRKTDVPAGYDLAEDGKADIKDVIWLKLKVI